jgi:hypothetical protein
LIHCLATDSHDKKNRTPTKVKKAAPEVFKLVGKKNFELIAYKNPLRVIKDFQLTPMDIAEIPETNPKIFAFRLPWVREKRSYKQNQQNP